MNRSTRNGFARNLFSIVGALAILTACTTVPLTQRTQLTLIPSTQILTLSHQEYRKVVNESRLSDDQQAVKNLRRVGLRMARAVQDFYEEKGLSYDFEWEFNLIQDDTVANAWCMPGGKIAFYTGILKFTQDDAGMAAVMGHEVAHAIAQHSNERMTQSMIRDFGTTMLSKALEDKPAETQSLFLTAVGIGTEIGVMLPFSRMQELEADHIGLILMAKAGFDPSEAIRFWERMGAANSGGTPEFLSTHPSDARRIQDLRKYLPEASRHYRPQSS